MELQLVPASGAFRDMAAIYEPLVNALGSPAFEPAVSKAIRETIPVDRLYRFDIEPSRRTRLHLAEYETTDRPTAEDVYVTQYLPVDPILSAAELAHGASGIACLRISPRDISQSHYRLALETADIVERISFVRRDADRWQCLNVARRAATGKFAERELARLARIAWFLLPLAARHAALQRNDERPGVTIAELERRLTALRSGLTAREVQVCARAAFGMSAEGAALDLKIGRASVLTYRKRAYARLGLTSANELFRLVMR